MKSFIVKYWSTNQKRTMLGGVSVACTSRFESRQHAELRLAGIIDIHDKLTPPLAVTGEILESNRNPEIFSDGSVIGCNWGRAAKRNLGQDPQIERQFIDSMNKTNPWKHCGKCQYCQDKDYQNCENPVLTPQPRNLGQDPQVVPDRQS